MSERMSDERWRILKGWDVPCPQWVGSVRREIAAELDRARASETDLLAVLKRMQESAAYWSEYDVPLGIVEDINAAIAKAEGREP